MHKRDFLKVTGLAAFSLLPGRARAQGKNILRMGLANEVLTLDPIKTVYDADIIIQGIMFSRLLRASADRKELFPGLAESYEISPDGKTYTFKIAEAKFSDGSPITAEDIAFSFTRMRFQKDSAYAGPYTALEKAEATDPRTVVMHLNKPFTPFIQNVEIWNSGIVPKAAVEKMGEDKFAQAPVTSGPFRLVEWRKGDRVILERNPHYYRAGLPYLDGVEILYVPDDNTRAAMLRAGEIDMMMAAPYQLIQQLGAEGFQAKPEPFSAITDFLLNHAAEPFSDIKVRQAVSIGIDRKAISDAVTLGLAQPASSLMAPVLRYFNTDLQVPVRDVGKARELLEQAGKPKLEFELLISAGQAADERTAVLIQSQLGEVGMTVNIRKMDSTQVWNSFVEGNYQATLNWWYNETLDPDVGLRWAVYGVGENKSYYTRYNNPKVNQLIEQAAAAPEGDARKALYWEAQKISCEEVAQIGLYYPPARNVYSARIQGMRLNPGYQFSTIDEVKLTWAADGMVTRLFDVGQL